MMNIVKIMGAVINAFLLLTLTVQPIAVSELEPQETDFLQEFANKKLKDLMENDYWSHSNSDGCDFQCRTAPYHADYYWIGEVLYRGTCNVSQAYKSWDESPPHKTVLDHEYDEEAMAIGSYKDNKCYIVVIRATY